MGQKVPTSDINDVILEQIDRALKRYSEARSKCTTDYLVELSPIQRTELMAVLAATLERAAPRGSRYEEAADNVLRGVGFFQSESFSYVVGLLKALRADYESGLLRTFQELIHGEVFGDFLEMADYLVEEGFKDPAAVMAGGVLEEHLRMLCVKKNLSIVDAAKPKRADRLNAELGHAKAYSKLDQKNVTAWLDLRNKAAHGRYNEYTKEQVALLIQGIRDFVSRNRA
jgi:hypothetical protein